jgi:hypothetical protein
VSIIASEQNPRGIVAGPQPMQLQPGPSFLRPEMVGVAGNLVPGPLNFQMRPLTPSPVLMQTQRPLYQNQIPGHGLVLQPQWPCQPPQAGAFMRAPFQPNPGTMPMVQHPVVLPGTTTSLAPIVPQRSDETRTCSAMTTESSSGILNIFLMSHICIDNPCNYGCKWSRFIMNNV